MYLVCFSKAWDHGIAAAGRHLVAVGSEDCSVSLVRICPGCDDNAECIKVVKTLQGHISSVRALSCSVSGNGEGKKLLFSGGARASLKVWSIETGTSNPSSLIARPSGFPY